MHQNTHVQSNLHKCILSDLIIHLCSSLVMMSEPFFSSGGLGERGGGGGGGGLLDLLTGLGAGAGGGGGSLRRVGGNEEEGGEEWRGDDGGEEGGWFPSEFGTFEPFLNRVSRNNVGCIFYTHDCIHIKVKMCLTDGCFTGTCIIQYIHTVYTCNYTLYNYYVYIMYKKETTGTHCTWKTVTRD